MQRRTVIPMTDTPCEQAAAIMAHYGAEAQKDILIEECAELIQATEKTRRHEDKPEITADMVEEMADVQIMLWQFLSLMNAYWRGEFDNAVSEKLRRQRERIENERVCMGTKGTDRGVLHSKQRQEAKS